MFTVLSPSASLLRSRSSSLSSSSSTRNCQVKPPSKLFCAATSLLSAIRPLAASIAAVSFLAGTAASDPLSFEIYYGTAASASSYGGYGGNSSKKASAEYIYEIPPGWKERAVSKVEKGTNGTDSEFYNPKRRSEREYLTFLSGFGSLGPMDTVLGNLALSDVELQDLIAAAGGEGVRSEERRDDGGQVYYEYEIEGGTTHRLISVTCARNKLYAHFVAAPASDWERDAATLRRIHDSFRTVDGGTQS